MSSLLFRQEQEGPHQEAVERVHALHEGDEAGCPGRVHPEGVGGHQSNPRQKGKHKHFIIIFFKHIMIICSSELHGTEKINTFRYLYLKRKRFCKAVNQKTRSVLPNIVNRFQMKNLAMS